MEIAMLDLRNTKLAVLSACETALGDITSEGVWGLQRAFKMAGVQTIVMSLWQVDDEATSILMQYFYEELFRQPQSRFSPHAALASAQRRMRQHPQYSSPYYWAAFIAID
jgi:CHAT domain-containing protein